VVRRLLKIEEGYGYSDTQRDNRSLTQAIQHAFRSLFRARICFGEAIDAQDGITVQRPQVKIVFLAMLLMSAACSEAAAPLSAAVTGVVRDAQGAVQMGALVQVVTGNAMVGSALTDLHGHYTIANLLPGRYQVKASAALFIPARHANLQLRSGAQAVVDLTLNTLFETSTWLPAERRRADEPGDDWKWTLRSAANRPILRWSDDGDVIAVGPESSRPRRHIDMAVLAGNGGFGDNGVHTVASLDNVLHDGAIMTTRADVGTAPGQFQEAPSASISTAYDRQLGFAGEARTVVSYQSHPELVSSDGTVGLQAFHLASARKMQFGDLVDLEVGGTVYMVRTTGLSAASQPFLKVVVHPSSTWTVGYRMATSQNLQSFAGLDAVPQELPVAVMYRGRLQTERGLHQEVALGRKLGSGVIQVAWYHDSLDRVMVSGGGALSPADLQQTTGSNADGVIEDTTTGNFRLLGAGYATQGVNITLSEPMTPGMWMALEYSTGAALAEKDAGATTLVNVSTSLSPQMAQSATLALKGRVLHSGTQIRAAYRWQPTRLVTAVDPYAAFSDQAYFSCYLRQAIRMGHFLPPGLDATVDVTNLLAQGYRPFLSADGETLFLAQAPRTVQAGLAFSF
jgi:Carboxypeptidase regulatory-like domain